MRRVVILARREACARRHAEIDAAVDPEFDRLLERLDALAPANDDTPPRPTIVPHGAPLQPANDDEPLNRKSRKAPVRPRRSLARDRRNVSILEGFVPDVRPEIRERAKTPLVGVPLSPSSAPSTPSTSFKTPISKETTKRKTADKNDTRKAPAWRWTTEIVRGACYVRSVSTTGAGLSWTLNLGGKVLQAANDNAGRFMGQMQDRLNQAFKAEFGEVRDFFFAIEETAGRPHLHGAVDATDNERDRVEAVLVRCGGTWASMHHKDKQAHATVMWGPDGWLRYSLKAMARTKIALGLKTVLCVTRGCRARAEALWQDSRPHAHGGIACTKEELPAVERALKRAGGA